MRFHVLGLGSIGSLLSYHLKRTLPEHHSITLIHKTQRQANLANEHQQIRLEVNGTVTTASGFVSEAFHPPQHTSSHGRINVRRQPALDDKIESLFVTTKAHQTVPAITRLAPRLSPNATIVLLQNGMGVYEELTHNIFPNPSTRPHFILASNTHGVYRKSSNHFVHAGIGGISFGLVADPHDRDFEAGFRDSSIPPSERIPRLSDISTVSYDPSYQRYRTLRDTVAALLLLEPLSVTWRPMAEVQTTMRQKLVVNAVINPLTAVLGCRNGTLQLSAASRRITERVCNEAEQVFRAQLIDSTETWLGSLAFSSVDSENASVDRMPEALTRACLEREVFRVAHITSGNISSMLSDIRVGRPTEVDFINGYLLKLGRTYGVRMPATATLLNLVKMRSAIPIDSSIS